MRIVGTWNGVLWLAIRETTASVELQRRAMLLQLHAASWLYEPVMFVQSASDDVCLICRYGLEAVLLSTTPADEIEAQRVPWPAF